MPRIQLKRRRSTATSNPYLAEGERVEEFDTGRAKVGPPGGAWWNDLPYQDDAALSMRNVFTLEPLVAGPLFTPAQRTAHIHAVIAKMDAAVAAGATGLTLEVPNHRYVVAWENATPVGADGAPGEALFVLPDECRLAGVGRAACVELDPATPPSSTGRILFQLGPNNSTRTGMTVEDLRIIANRAVINGGSIFPTGSRRSDTDTGQVASPRFRRLRLEDVQIGISFSSNTARVDMGELYTDVTVEDVRIDGALNRAVEYAMVKGGLIRDLAAYDAASVFNLLSFVSGVKVQRARGTYSTNGGGAYIGFEVRDCEISDCEITGAAGASGGSGALEFHSEPGVAEYVTEGIRFYRNKWGYFPGGATHRSLSWQVNTTVYPAQAIIWRDIRFVHDEFAGDTMLYPSVQGSTVAVEITDLHFVETRHLGPVYQQLTSTAAGGTNLHDYSFTRAYFKHAADIKASRGTYDSCTWDVTPTIDPAATDVILINPITPTPIDTTGLDPSVQVINNIVRPLPSLDPTTLGVTWADFNPDDLADGALTTWAPSPGSAKSAVLTKLGSSSPTVVAAAAGTHKVVRFVAASSQRMSMVTPWDTPLAMPRTFVVLAKLNSMPASGSNQNLVTGQSISEATITLDNAGGLGQVTTRPTSSGAALSIPSAFAGAGVWVPLIVVQSADAGATKIYAGSAIKSGSNMSAAIAMNGIHVGSSGSGNPNFLDGDVARVLVLSRAVDDDEAAGIMRWLTSRYAL